MLDVRYSHLYFYQSLNSLQRGLSAIAELLVLHLFQHTSSRAMSLHCSNGRLSESLDLSVQLTFFAYCTPVCNSYPANNYLHQRGYVLPGVCLSVISNLMQILLIGSSWKFYQKYIYKKRKNLLNFGSHPHLDQDREIFEVFFNIAMCHFSTIWLTFHKNCRSIFMKFLS